jgi:tetratricopeptide (TPR) repeat protein
MRAISVATIAVAVTLGAGWTVARVQEPARPALDSAAAEIALRGEHIAFYERRVTEDTESAADLGQLAGLYLQRARESGEIEDYHRAERAARRSVAIRSARNGKTRLVLASSLLARHRFPEALQEARALVAASPEVSSYRALLGEIEMEMGEYDAARATFAALDGVQRELAVAPRLARWAEITGRTPQARRLLLRALADASARVDLPNEQVAWFHLRVGDLELRDGRLRAAADAFRAGLAVRPGDERLLAGMARVAAARRKWRRVIAYGDQLGERADIATLALVGDAYAARGDSADAERWYARAEAKARANPEPFNRQWTLFRLEHGRDVRETLTLLREENRVRRDIYGYDQLALALLLSGEYREARTAMAQALHMGTRDPMLLRHAGMIERTGGAIVVSR